jgi:hypothetical protein
MKHGNRTVGVATWHENTCDICGVTAAVTEPRDYGHLKDTWIKEAEKHQPERTMNDTPRIIQLLMSPNDSVWQGVLLGLGDDGTTYHCQGDTWQPYIPPLNPQDKATELAVVTEQRDTTRKLYDVACETAAKMHAAAVGEIKGPHIDPVQDILDLRRERDRLAEALKRIAGEDYRGNRPQSAYIAEEALQSLTPKDHE